VLTSLDPLNMDHIVVIGAGQAGSSCVAKLRAEGFTGQITLVGGEPVPPYQRPPLSKAYLLGEMAEERLYLRPAAFYADNDITLRLNTRAVAIDADAKRVTLEGDDVLSYDHLVLTTGAHPRTLPAAIGGTLNNVFTVRDLAEIATNAMGQTSNPAIWAAGDCASAPLHGAQIRIESVGNAIDQAEVVARNIMGAATPYTPKPWFWSDQYDCKLQIAGLNVGYDAVHVRADGAARSHWYYKGRTLIAVDAMNDPRNYMIGKRLIEAGKSPDPAVLTDPETDMKALLKA